MNRAPTLEWFGTATFRIRTDGLDLFFDSYLDRLPGVPPVGLSTREVGRADFVFVSHAHFDHLWGADVLARQTGAVVVCSPESARCLRDLDLPEEQLLVVTGGETVHCEPSGRVRARVLPALHSCLFAHNDRDTSVPCLGDVRLERATSTAEGRCVLHVGLPRTCAGRSGAPHHARCMLVPRRRRSGLSADNATRLGPCQRQRRILAGDLRRPTPRCGLAGHQRATQRGRGALPGNGGKLHGGSGSRAPCGSRGLLSPRSSVPRPALGRCRTSRCCSECRWVGVLRHGVRDSSPVVRVSRRLWGRNAGRLAIGPASIECPEVARTTCAHSVRLPHTAQMFEEVEPERCYALRNN